MNYIHTNPAILRGKPVIKGTRISVEFILKLLSQGKDTDYILSEYPQLTREDILVAIEYAHRVVTEDPVAWQRRMRAGDALRQATGIWKDKPRTQKDLNRVRRHIWAIT